MFFEHDHRFCQKCGIEFENYEDFLADYERHVSVCQFCNKSFKNPSFLNVHIRRHHTGDNNEPKKEICPECGDLFVNLKEHIKRVHSGGEYKKFMCSHCDYRYITYLTPYYTKNLIITFSQYLKHNTYKRTIFYALYVTASKNKAELENCYIIFFPVAKATLETALSVH